MGDSSLTLEHRRRCSDAVEGDVTYGPEATLHRRLPEALLLGIRAVRAIRRQPQDRVQVDRALPGGRPGRASGSVAQAACVPPPEPRGDRRSPAGGSASPSNLGGEETASHSLSKTP